jgi:hypothetical protein
VGTRMGYTTHRAAFFMPLLLGGGLALTCLADRCKTRDAINHQRLPLPKLPPLSLTDNVFSRSQPSPNQK